MLSSPDDTKAIFDGRCLKQRIKGFFNMKIVIKSPTTDSFRSKNLYGIHTQTLNTHKSKEK